MHEYSDFRSDTVTQPTERMKQAAMTAPLGDDVMQEDPTTNRLEVLAAKVTGKQAALFVTSGTQANLIALMTWCSPGDEVIMDDQCHVILHEQAGLARLAFAQPRTLPQKMGMMDLDAVRAAVRGEDIHFPVTRVITCENTHNRAGGVVLPINYLKGLHKIADERGLKVHIDGARLFNASVASGVPAKDIARYADSVMFCLSKGLCCPIGSVLCGTKDFIEKARRIRKLLGGGMRQTGFVTALGIVALTEMVDRLKEDHVRARRLGEGVAHIRGLSVDLETVQTNMVYFRVKNGSADALVKRLANKKVLCFAEDDDEQIRMVAHKDIDDDDVERALSALSKCSK